MCHVSHLSPVYHIRFHLFLEYNKRIVGVQRSRKHHVYLIQVPYLTHVSAITTNLYFLNMRFAEGPLTEGK